MFYKGLKTMSTGNVKWFKPTKGFGFVEFSNGGENVFVHISAEEQAGLSTLQEGQKIEFELVVGRNGKSSAEKLVISD